MKIELKCGYDDNDEDIIIELPAKWVVCDDCRGEGKYPNRNISPTGDGSWTQSEMAEACYDDPDFLDDYVGGTYDISCRTCEGRTTVKEVDVAYLNEEEQKQYDLYLKYEEEEAAFQTMCAAERAMGA